MIHPYFFLDMGSNFSSATLYLQPAIAGPLGPIANVSASTSHAVERTERMPQPMSLGNLVMFTSNLFTNYIANMYFSLWIMGLFAHSFACDRPLWTAAGQQM